MNVNFRRALSNNFMSRYEEEGGVPGETTSLLPNGRDRNNRSGGGNAGWKRFFFNARATPGTEHPNVLVRYSASTWHVTKVTLLSSESTMQSSQCAAAS